MGVLKLCVYENASVCVYLLKNPTKTTGPRAMYVLYVCVCYLRGLVGSPAVLVAVDAGQQHVLIRIHLAKAQSLVGIVADHIVAVNQLLGLQVPILREKSGVRVKGRMDG